MTWNAFGSKGTICKSWSFLCTLSVTEVRLRFKGLAESNLGIGKAHWLWRFLNHLLKIMYKMPPMYWRCGFQPVNQAVVMLLDNKGPDQLINGAIIWWHYWEAIETWRWSLVIGTEFLGMCPMKMYHVPGPLLSVQMTMTKTILTI